MTKNNKNLKKNIDIDKDIMFYAYRGIRRAYFFAGFISSSENSLDIKDIHPHERHKLNFGEIPEDKMIENVNEFKSWILKNSVREAVELFSITLDKIFAMFILLKFETSVKPQNVSKFPKLPFPDKLKFINEFLIEDIIEQNIFFQSLQDLRNCIAHNISIVDKKDGIKIQLPKVELYLENKNGELKELVIGEVIKEESSILLKFTYTEKFFKEGDFITFTPEEIVQICKALDKSILKLRTAIINAVKK